MRSFNFILAVLASASSGMARAEQPANPVLNFVFEETVNLGEAVPLTTPRGARNLEPIIGGQFAGPNIRGVIVAGGWDWQSPRSDGCFEIAADYFIKTDDGVVIKVHDTGVACPPVDGVAQPVRTHPVFEAPEGKYSWLNRQTFVGALQPSSDQAEPGVRINIYAVQ